MSTAAAAAYVFEDHEVVKEKDGLAGEEFPDGLASLAFRHRHRLARCRRSVGLSRRRHNFRPVTVLYTCTTHTCYAC